MRYIPLTETERITLQEAVCNHASAIVRTQSQALLLSNRRYLVKELGHLYQVLSVSGSLAGKQWVWLAYA